PGDTTEEKMKECIFNLIPSSDSEFSEAQGYNSNEKENEEENEQNEQKNLPKLLSEAFQVFECTWLDNLENADKFQIQEEYEPPYNDFNGITSKFGAHFILKIDRILLKKEYKDGIVDGVNSKTFPKIPVDYGYRDNTNFWISKFKKPYAEPIPKNKSLSLDTITYAADRMHTHVKFTDGACGELSQVPRLFLKTALKECIGWAEKNDVDLITKEHMAIIRDKRSDEKTKK
ncbi:MAG: hypothetical protein ACTSYI_13615, partial [Promethearchaeota archaeon]